MVSAPADVQPENAQACRAAGMDDVLAKPIVPQQLISKIVEWGSRSEAEAAAEAAGAGVAKRG